MLSGVQSVETGQVLSLVDPSQPADLAKLQGEVLQLSEKYVRELADQHRKQVRQDGPYAGVRTAYDLKKTLAVLLQSYNSRLEQLEQQVADMRQQKSRVARAQPDQPAQTAEQVDLIGLFNGVQEQCPLPNNWQVSFPNCEEKVKWMKSFWESDACYAALGVDGTVCSFLIYLSEHESHCPPLSWRPAAVSKESVPLAMAERRRSVQGLLSLMSDNPGNYDWIRRRVLDMWPHWQSAADQLLASHPHLLLNSTKRSLLFHMGFLTKETGLKFGEKSMHGGPLGELVQWSDLMAAAYLLGHDVTLSSETSTLLTFVKADPSLKSSCPVKSDRQQRAYVDVVYIDIIGVRQLRRKLPGVLPQYRCRLRVLDSFGTQAQFNDPNYYLQHKKELGGHKNVWGGHKLNLQQFYTLYR